VAGAQVLVRGTRFQALSGADGSYLFMNVPAGSYGITCAAIGLRGASTGAVDLTPDTTRDFSLAVPGEGTHPITGSATCGGIACAGVIVVAQQDNQVRGVGLSGADGAYSVEGLAPGAYELTALALGHLQSGAGAQVHEPTDAGWTPSVVNFDLTPVPAGFTVRGVVGLSDNPLDRSGSTVRCNGQTPTLTDTTDASGVYELPATPAGPLSFSAFKTGYRAQNRIDVIVSGDTTLNFVLVREGGGSTDPTYAVSGTVTLTLLDGGSAGPGPTRVSLWEPGGTEHATTTPDADGHYRIGGLRAGTYQAGAAREGFLPSTSDPFELSGDRTLDFQLQPDPAYDWGPGEGGGELGCTCGIGTGGPALALCLLVFLRRRRAR
jgi:hypothetical protein